MRFSQKHAAAGPLHFVGREDEQHVLQAALDQARSGNGRLVMLMGEAGIGKTSLARKFTGSAATDDATVVWGRCFEGEGHRPYHPWSEALDEYARAVGDERLRQELDSNAPALAQLVPGVRAALPSPLQPAPLLPDEERFRLYDAVTQWLLAAGQEQPVVIVLDDLHWADRESLELLRYVARFIHRMRVLFIGTYRDPDLDFERNQPLLDVLAVLVRETNLDRILLRGLSISEVADYLDAAGRRDLPLTLIKRIHAATEGNPFYTLELFRHLAEEGVDIDAAVALESQEAGSALGVPTGVRQVLRRRLSRLSDATSNLLRVAAALTGGFQFQVLQALADLPEDTLLDCLDEALAAGLLRLTDAQTGTYDFAHAIVRHTLYDELNPDRQARLHRRIAQALERVYTGRTAEIAAELAAQYHASRMLSGAEQGVSYALIAADQARSGYARERIVSFLRMARDLAQASPQAVQADILARLAVAEAEALMFDAAPATVESAVGALMDSGGHAESIVALLVRVARSLKEGGASPSLWEPLVERGLALLGEERDLLWARLTLLRDRWERIPFGSFHVSRWRGYDPAAVAVARASGDEDDYAQTLEPFDWRAPEETASILALARTWRNPVAFVRALNAVGRDTLFYHANFTVAIDRAQELLSIATRCGSLVGRAEALVLQAATRAALGDLALAQQTAQTAREIIAHLGEKHRLHVVIDVALASVLAYYLDHDWPYLVGEATRLAARPAEGRRGIFGLYFVAFAALGHVRLGNTAAARELLDMLTPALQRMQPTMYQHNICVHAGASAVWELQATMYATQYRQMAYGLIAARVGDSQIGSSALTIARMAALAGDRGEASRYFAQARVHANRNGQRALRAIIDYDEAVASMSLGSADTGGVAALLDAGLDHFRSLGMSRWVQRALQQQESLTHSHPAPTASGGDYPDGLTPREVDVLRLIAGGRTTREIAQELFVSIATVERHITNLYGKIGARGRADATAYALSHELT